MARALEAIFPTVHRLIICRLFEDPEKWWNARSLAASDALPEAQVRRMLTQFAAAGVARVRREGRRCFYQPDPGSPAYPDLLSLVRKFGSAPAGVTILVVEDQKATAQITRILLENWGYRVLEAHSANEAVEIFTRQRAEIALVLTDVVLPEMDGPTLAERLLELKPGLRIIYMSGAEFENGNRPFLPKPFNPVGLARVVRREVEQIAPALERSINAQ